MSPEAERSRQARRAAERALVRVIHHYGATPEFVLLAIWKILSQRALRGRSLSPSGSDP